MTFDIIPAIDLKAGQCVRLKQGRMQDTTVYHQDPVVAAKKWLDAGARRLHIVDLDGAFAGEPMNRKPIESICLACPDLHIQVGGGIRTIKTLEAYFASGVHYAILGTSAVKNPSFVCQASDHYPQQVILGVDAKAGKVALEGWDEASTLSAGDLVGHFAAQPLAAIIYTDISRDGMLQGVNIEETTALAECSPFPVIASGGVKNLADIKALHQAHSNIRGVIAGRALYSGDLVLSEALSFISS